MMPCMNSCTLLFSSPDESPLCKRLMFTGNIVETHYLHRKFSLSSSLFNDMNCVHLYSRNAASVVD